MKGECPESQSVRVDEEILPYKGGLGRGLRTYRKLVVIQCSKTEGRRNRRFGTAMTTEQKRRFGLCEDCPYC
jgi:hypothetical protein